VPINAHTFSYPKVTPVADARTAAVESPRPSDLRPATAASQRDLVIASLTRCPRTP